MFRLRTNPRAAKEALADIDKALKLDPRCRPALQNKAHVLAEHLKKQEEARQVLERLLEMYPGDVPALAGQAVVLARLKKRQEAHRHIGEALARDPTPQVRYQAACVYALTSRRVPSDAQVALTYLREAVKDRYGLDILDKDPDLAPLRGTDGFRPLVRDARRLLELTQRLQAPPVGKGQPR
jgi:tetratricopeptide (TPR) repeat protein